MKEKFQTFAQLCTRSLAGDPMLRLEVEREQESHLEDVYEEERSEGKSESEAEDQAKKRFGEPEELAQSLLDANLRRLKLRARIRLAIKVALIPAILVGLVLCINLRTLSAMIMLGRHRETKTESLQEKMINAQIRSDMRTIDKADKDFVMNFLGLWQCGKESEWELERYRANPDSRIFTANYALSLIPSPNEHWEEQNCRELRNVIEHGRRIDPDNALYDYLEVKLILHPALTWHPGKTPKTAGYYTIADRAEFDRGMKLYLAALEKPFVNTYNMDVVKKAQQLLNPRKDLLGMMENISIYGSVPFRFNAEVRALTRESIFYGETLEKEGKSKEAKAYFDSWRQFIPQMLEHNSDMLMEVRNYYGCIRAYLASARQRGDTGETEKLKKIENIIAKWDLRRDPNGEGTWKHSGLFSAIFLSQLHEKIEIEDLAPGRKLTYLVSDTISMALQSLLLGYIIAVLALTVLILRLFGKRPFLVVLSRQSYLKILTWGILSPIALFLIYTHIDFLGGRNVAIGWNLPRFLIGQLGFILVFPLVFGAVFTAQLRKQGEILGFAKGKLPSATVGLNLLCGFVALLLITGGILRPLLSKECGYWVTKDPLLKCGIGFSKPETQITAELGSKLRLAIDSTDYAGNSAKN